MTINSRKVTPPLRKRVNAENRKKFKASKISIFRDNGEFPSSLQKKNKNS